MSQYGGDQLPGRTGRVAPRRRNGDRAVVPRIRIEAEEPSLPPGELLPFVRRGKASLHQPALRRDLGDVHELRGRHEIELKN